MTMEAPRSVPASSSAASSAEPGSPLLAFATVLGVALCVAWYVLCARAPSLYAVTGVTLSRGALRVAGVAGFVLGASLVPRPRPADWASMLCGGALTFAVSGALLGRAFVAQGRDLLLAFGVAGVGLGCVSVVFISVARFAVALGAVERGISPFRVLSGLVIVALSTSMAAAVGVVRALAGVSLVHAALALAAGGVARYLLPFTPRDRSWPRWLVFACGLLLLGAAEHWLPLRELARATNEVVWSQRAGEARVVLTVGQDALEIWVDGHPALATLVDARRSEGIVRPAFATAPAAPRVLVLGGVGGTWCRNVPIGAQVTWVPDDADAAIAIGRLPVVARDPARAHLPRPVASEVLPWLTDYAGAPFDVVIVDLPEPSSYRYGKFYTRGFYRLVAAQLAPGGVAALVAPSGFRAPEALGATRAAVSQAGLTARTLRLALPTFGEASVLLAGHELPAAPTPLPGASYLDAAGVSDLVTVPSDARGSDDRAPSTLDHQRVVDLWLQGK